MLIADQVLRAFQDRFGGRPRLFAAPGRINVIGEHTDYSEGFVMPAAINRACVAAVSPNGGRDVRVFALNRREEALISGTFARTGTWIDYVAGVRAALNDAGVETPGCDLVIGGNVPEGAGVSSSAALEVATVYAMLSCSAHAATPVDVARWAQMAESTYVGMPCGVMDQFIAANGVAGHALKLDCRTLAFETVRLPESASFVVVDSQVRHRLVDGGYAARRADCEAAAARLGLAVLRDASPDMLQEHVLPERLLRRARHVIMENQRVIETAAAFAFHDMGEAGRLMNASHASLRDDFDVTCAETDLLAEIAGASPGVFGARQMGGGFGGAVLALVDAEAATDASARIIADYKRMSGVETEAFTCQIGDGAREISS